jgi:peptidyl-prolyl cis-trans isomerase C
MTARKLYSLAGLALFAGVCPLPAQDRGPAAPPAAPKPAGPNDVVAVVEGEKITPARLQQLRESLPPNFRQQVSSINDREFLKSYATLVALSRRAEQEKVAEREPYKDQLAFLRMNFLAQSYLDYLGKHVKVSQLDFQQYYNEHQRDYQEAKVRALYVAFSPNADPSSKDPKVKGLLTEQQAKAKAESLWGQLKKGADFEKLARENSDDKDSAKNGGDIGTIKRSSGAPAELKDAIFALQPGEISAPVRQPAGFYIFKLESLRTVPFEEVAGNIATAVQGAKVKEELDRIMKSVQITFENESYFDPPAAPGRAQPAKPAK